MFNPAIIFWLTELEKHKRKTLQQIYKQPKKITTMYEQAQGMKGNKSVDTRDCEVAITTDFQNVHETFTNRISYNRDLVNRIFKAVDKIKQFPDSNQKSSGKEPEPVAPGFVNAILDQAYSLSKTNDLLEVIVNHLETIV